MPYSLSLEYSLILNVDIKNPLNNFIGKSSMGKRQLRYPSIHGMINCGGFLRDFIHLINAMELAKVRGHY